MPDTLTFFKNNKDVIALQWRILYCFGLIETQMVRILDRFYLEDCMYSFIYTAKGFYNKFEFLMFLLLLSVRFYLLSTGMDKKLLIECAMRKKSRLIINIGIFLLHLFFLLFSFDL